MSGKSRRFILGRLLADEATPGRVLSGAAVVSTHDATVGVELLTINPKQAGATE
jgi:hypothetical protein